MSPQHHTAGSTEVEFVAGPLDGHTEKYASPTPFVTVQLVTRQSWSSLLSRLLRRRNTSTPSRFAIYELCVGGGRSFYRHLATRVELDCTHAASDRNCARLSYLIAARNKGSK
jgi:hypothetical protein